MKKTEFFQYLNLKKTFNPAPLRLSRKPPTEGPYQLVPTSQLLCHILSRDQNHKYNIIEKITDARKGNLNRKVRHD